MRIQDFNAGDPAPPPNPVAPPAPARPPIKRSSAPDGSPDPLACAEAKIALLQARITHLEAVIEAARGLMTSNQERLLRRLHDTPREIAALSTRVDRLSAGGPAWYETAGASK
jgi:hypothetical protein